MALVDDAGLAGACSASSHVPGWTADVTRPTVLLLLTQLVLMSAHWFGINAVWWL